MLPLSHAHALLCLCSPMLMLLLFYIALSYAPTLLCSCSLILLQFCSPMLLLSYAPTLLCYHSHKPCSPTAHVQSAHISDVTTLLCTNSPILLLYYTPALRCSHSLLLMNFYGEKNIKTTMKLNTNLTSIIINYIDLCDSVNK